jgi:phosphoribosyl 1,2-cyclic phosphate phosphodiesterase
MRLEVLGSGGATSTPRPGCDCRICVEAREKGAPFARTGPSYFLHGPNVLVDTPEESALQLNRAGIAEVSACFYSHWHPDHTMGRRVWEQLNRAWRALPQERPRIETPIYLPEQVAADFRTRRGIWDHFEYLADSGDIRVVELRDGDDVEVGGWTFRPFRLAEDYVYAFLIEGDRKRVLLAPDETNGWDPPGDVGGVDLAVIPMGICEFHPLTGERRIHVDHPLLRLEATFEETLAIVEALEARRIVLSHIEEMDGLSYDDLLELGRRHGVEFAYDGMVLDV